MKLSKAEVQHVEAVSSTKAVRRKSRTISLNDDQFVAFQKECEARELEPNRVLDALIALFLETKDPK